MPKGRDNVRHVYPSDTEMGVILVNPLLRQHVETVRRRFAEADWTLDARIDPADRTVIIITHHGGETKLRLRTRSSDLTKRIRDNPPDIVEPLGADSLADEPVGSLPRPARTSGMSDSFSVPAPERTGQTVLQLTGIENPLLSNLILTVLQHGHPVDVTVGDVTVHISPK